jgi:hypothetical protein
MAGIKQSGSLRKKAAPPILLLCYLFVFRNKAIKLSGARHLFLFFEGDFLSAIRTVLARRHRSHYSSGFIN